MKTDPRQAMLTALDRTDRVLCVLYSHIVAEQHRRLRIACEQREAERAQRMARGVGRGRSVQAG